MMRVRYLADVTAASGNERHRVVSGQGDGDGSDVIVRPRDSGGA